MPAAIVLKDLSWSTPDGHPLFQHLDLAFGSGRTGLIGRNGVGKTTLLKIIAGELSPAAGSVSTRGRIAVLRQSVQVDEDDTVADGFGIGRRLALLDRIAAGDATADQAAEADWSLPARFHAALARMGLADLRPDHPLGHLSGGQRTRVALASLVFQAPDMILLDEPTNNLDRDGRDAVAQLLASWRRGAVVVSHDRALLEQMDAIVDLTTLGARTYGGNWSHYRAQQAIEADALRHRLETAERKVADVDRRLRATAERKARKDAAGRRKRAKADAPKIVLDATRQRSEETGAANARLANRRRQAAAEDAADARARIEKLKALTVTVPSAGVPKGKTIVEVCRLTGGYDRDAPVVRDVSFTLVGPERVAIVGPNGCGKTTLLRLVTGDLKPFAGQVRRHAPHAVLDQAMGLLDADLTVRENFLKLNPGTDENACRASLARFLFRADAALKTVRTLSGGQVLRAGLAAVLGGARPPALLLLDEPTNHLDLESVEAMEAGLSAYDGALVVVSHDRAFLEALRIDRWIEMENGRAADPR